jgi:hypothetical protein
MRLEKRLDESFPSKSVRSKSKETFVKELLEYCRTHVGHKDVEQILKNTSQQVEPKELFLEEEKGSQGGTVYLIHAGNHYKIGFTNALYRRASQIANGHPNGAELIHSFETDDPRGIEAYWQNRFADKRVKGVNIASGEWFTLSKSDVAAFCKRKRFM